METVSQLCFVLQVIKGNLPQVCLVLQVRKEIVPVNRKWPLESLITALQDLLPRSSSRNSHARHVLIEYVMLAGINDSLEDAHRCCPSVGADIKLKLYTLLMLRVYCRATVAGYGSETTVMGRSVHVLDATR